MMRRPLPIVLGLLVIFVVGDAFAERTLGLKEPYEEAEYRMRLEEEARAAHIAELQESVPVDMSVREQKERLRRLSENVLGAESVRERLRAHADLLAMVEPLYDALEATVLNPRADVAMRSIAVWALGERGSPRACEILSSTSLLQDAALYNLSLATAHGRCGSIDALRTLVSTGSEYVRPRAAVVIAMLDARQLRTAITRAEERNEDENYDDYFILARGLLLDASTIEDLTRMLNDRDLHMHAAVALARLGEQYVVFDLLAATLSPEALIRWAAVKELIPLTDELSVVCDRLERFATDDDLQIVELHRQVEEFCF